MSLPDAPQPALTEHARMTFARTLHLWRLRAGWAHDTMHDWGDAAGFASVRNSTYSKLERGKIVSPGLITFISLGDANRRLAAEDYGVIANQRLRELVSTQEPICGDDDQPWTALEFLAHFLGVLEAPHWARQESAYLSDPEAAALFSEHQRQQFLRFAVDRFLAPAEAWQQLQGKALEQGMDMLQIEQFRLVLAGHHKWMPEELRGLIDEIGRNRAELALNHWIDDQGLNEQLRNRLAG